MMYRDIHYASQNSCDNRNENLLNTKFTHNAIKQLISVDHPQLQTEPQTIQTPQINPVMKETLRLHCVFETTHLQSC